MPLSVNKKQPLFNPLFLLVILAFLLRLFYLAKDQFWMDEAYSAIISAWPFHKIIAEIPGIGSPPLYHFFLHFWIQWFGTGEWALRFPSVIFGVLLVVLIYNTGRHWFNKQVGVLAALIVSVNALHIFYSQQTRVYALLILVSLLSAQWLYSYLIKQKCKYFIGYTLSLIFLLYSHNWALFLIPVPYVFMMFQRPGWPLFFKILLAHTLVFLAYLPFLPCLIEQASSGSSAWVPYYWEQLGSYFVFLKSFEIFFSGGQFMTFGKIPYGRILPGLLLVFLMIMALLPMRLLRRLFGDARSASLQPPRNEKENDVMARSPSLRSRTGFAMKPSLSLKFLLCTLFVPLLIPYLFSFYRPIYIPGRYDIIVFPFFCLLIAFGFSQLKRSFLVPLLSLFLILMTLNLGGYYFFRTPRQENRQMAQFLSEQGKPGDLIIFTGMTRTPIQYYLGAKFQQFEFLHFPKEASQNIGYFDYPKYLANQASLIQEAEEIASTIENTSPRRIWVCSNRWLKFIFGPEAESLNTPLYQALKPVTSEIKKHPFRKAFILELKPAF